MMSIPVVPQFVAFPEGRSVDRALRLAEDLAREQPRLEPDESLRAMMPDDLDQAPALHLDDLSGIAMPERAGDITFQQDRARLRAGDGEVVASCTAFDEDYERYCEEQLGLGAVTWFHPRPRLNSLSVATACWTDRTVRRELVRNLRTTDLRYIHPYMGTSAVWIAADLLQRASHRPIKVIAPPPTLTESVNNKLWFADVVRRLFGGHSVPPTAHAYNLATLSMLVRAMAVTSSTIVVKLPDAAGGSGNLVLDAQPFRRRSLGKIRAILKQRLRPLGWEGERRLLVGSWETSVLCAPSVQVWIPPQPAGAPVVEGLFEQIVEGERGTWKGCRRVRFSSSLTREMIDRCWLLARLYQRLSYVGRCSFDLLLVGKSLDSCRIQFLECNGRWGGASLPMTLMNRLFGDHASQPFATRACCVPGLERFGIGELLEIFADDMFDVRTGRGHLILLNPGGLSARSGIDVLALARTWEAAARTVEVDFPARLERLVEAGPGRLQAG